MNNEWQYHVVKGISWLVCRLPYKLILLIGASLGPLYGVIAKKQKLRGIKNIKIGMNMNDEQAEALIEKLFKNLGRSVMEILYMSKCAVYSIWIMLLKKIKASLFLLGM